MFLGKVLEVGIGLAFLFLLIALIASALQELVASLLKLRGKYLVQAVSNLLANSETECLKAWHRIFTQKIREFAWEPQSDTNLPSWFGKKRAPVGSPLFLSVVNHPLFREVAPKSIPSYVPARNFALAVVDVLKSGVTPANQRLAGKLKALDQQLGDELGALVTALPASPEQQRLAAIAADQTLTLNERLRQIKSGARRLSVSAEQERLTGFLDDPDRAAQLLSDRIAATVRELPDGPARTALMSLVADAAGNLELLRRNLETWFNDSMDRVSGVYKRFTQYFILVFALFGAVLFNVNAIEVASALWKDDMLRASLSEAAATYVEDCVAEPSKTGCPPPLREETAAAGAETQGASEQPNADQSNQPATDPPQSYKEAQQRFTDLAKAVDERLEPLSLPIGWDRPQRLSLDWLFGSALPGWLITAFAVMFGAPFWFDLLKLFLNIRGAGPKPSARDSAKATQ